MGKRKYAEYGNSPGHLFNEETSGCSPRVIVVLGATIIFLLGKAFLRR